LRAKPIVFLIDSDESVRVTHETILRTEGYEIVTAAEGSRALSQIRESPPALILLGTRIGQMSCAQLIRVVKHDIALSGVKVAVCVPASAAALRLECEDAGGDRVLELPVRAEELVREVVGLIGRA
jgi:DNA-binding response OmpR family regulator